MSLPNVYLLRRHNVLSQDIEMLILFSKWRHFAENLCLPSIFFNSNRLMSAVGTHCTRYHIPNSVFPSKSCEAYASIFCMFGQRFLGMYSPYSH